MIKLTLNPEAEAKEYRFDSLPVRIGPSSAEGVALALPEGTPEELLLEIREQAGTLFLANIGNKIIATLNGIEFEKESELDTGDRIYVNEFVLLFENEASPEAKNEFSVSDEELDTLLDDVNALESDQLSADFLAAEPTEEDLELERELEEILSGGELDLSGVHDTEELSDEDIDALVAEADRNLTSQAAESTESTSEPSEEVFEFGLEEPDDEPTNEAPDTDLAAPNEEPELASAESSPEEALQDEAAEVEAKEAEEEETKPADLILEFQEGEVDDELEEVIVQKQRSESVSSISMSKVEDALPSTEDNWGHIERDIIDSDALSEEDTQEQIDSVLSYDPFEEEPRNLKKYLLVASLILCALGIIGSYLTIQVIEKQNSHDELMAARGLADVAMALTHARFESQNTYQYELSDSDFIERHLNGVLSADYRRISTSTARNGFIGTKYLLETYSQQEPPRFLLVARPVDDWTQKVSPRAGFIVDSQEMKIRRDLKSSQWEMLFEGRKSIDLLDPTQLELAVNSTTIQQLSILNANSISSGFAVPKDLPYVMSGAEAILYNAPRYYSFTNDVVERLSSYTDESTSQRDRAVLRHRLEQLNHLPNLVLYGTGDSGALEKAQNALERDLPPGLQFLLGEVLLHEEHGTVVRSDILLDETAFALLEQQRNNTTPDLDAEPEESKVALNTDHPLFITLMELSSQRQEALQAIGSRIGSLLNKHAKKEEPGFEERFQELTNSFFATSQDHQKKISRILVNLHKDYVADNPEATLALFLESVKATELEHLLPKELRETESHPAAAEVTLYAPPKTFEELLAKVDKSSNLKILNDRLEDLDGWLQGVEEPRAELLAKQNKIKSIVLRKVGHLLLSPDSTLTKQSFQERNRLLLAKILNLAHVNEDEERTFYLTEFDHLMQRFRGASAETGILLKELNKQEAEVAGLAGGLANDPEIRAELTKQKLKAEGALKEQRSEIITLKDQLSKVPLRTATTSPEEQQRNYGRIGQQILIHQSLQPPSVERDRKLREAIGLLSQSKTENRALWADILEARRLLAETPQSDITAVLRSDLGFSNTRYPLAGEVRKAFKRYLSAKKKLTRTKSDEQYAAQYSLFKKQERDNLERILELTEKINSQSNQLVDRFDDYIARMNEFLEDYITARDEGFFADNQSFHSNMLYQLQKKIESVAELRKHIQASASELVSAASTHQNLADSELRKLSGEEYRISSEEVAQLQQQHNRISYPNVLAANLKKRVDQMFKQEIFPIPQ